MPEKAKTAGKPAPKTTDLGAKAMVLSPQNVIVESPQIVIRGGYILKDKLIFLLVFLVILGSLAVGYLYGKVSVYEKGAVVAKAGQAAQPTGDTAAQQAAAQPQTTDLTADQWSNLISKAEFAKGPKDAKVTMVEFTDYQCPFCERYYTDSFGKIMKDYVDTGKVRYISMDLPLPFHPNAKPAALAARCAADQNKYWEMHDILFERQTEWSEGDPTAKFEGYAKQLGLNTNKFTQCVSSGQFNKEIEASSQLAQTIGANGTPTFYVNGKQVVGAQPYTEFQKALDTALQ
jgi:protein-disulfide isomerase